MTTIWLLHTNFGNTIWDKILNYNEAVNSIYGGEDFCLNTDQCDCADPSFCDPHHKYIITEDLRKIKNNQLRKLLTINVSKASIETVTALDACIEAMTLKTKYITINFKPWKGKVLVKVKKQITEFKNKS